MGPRVGIRFTQRCGLYLTPPHHVSFFGVEGAGWVSRGFENLRAFHKGVLLCDGDSRDSVQDEYSRVALNGVCMPVDGVTHT